ncbi:MAG: STAS domain-containing protein [Bacteroidota bacterium]
MTINEERRGKIGILSLRGSFSGKPGVAAFERAIFDLLKDDIIFIILDLEQLKFIDSAGLGAMISAMVSIGRRGGALKLAELRGDIYRVMTSMHLDQVFELHDTVEEAETSLVRKGRS